MKKAIPIIVTSLIAFIAFGLVMVLVDELALFLGISNRSNWFSITGKFLGGLLAVEIIGRIGPGEVVPPSSHFLELNNRERIGVALAYILPFAFLFLIWNDDTSSIESLLFSLSAIGIHYFIKFMFGTNKVKEVM